ncbi:MAG: aminotransferase class I/II-fold pyridoxal phosphate-dependent enzyme [Candidatus Nitrosocaldaceae archaeon]
MSIDELENNRREIKKITIEIIDNVKKRMDLAKKIGDIKQRYGLSIIDNEKERELRSSIMDYSNKIGLDPNFASRLLNLLIDESRRLQSKDEESITPTQIFVKSKELERSGKKIIHLEIGEPDLDPPIIVGKALNEAIEKKRYRYTEAAGIIELRDAIAKRLGVEYKDVIITPGGRFGVYLAISLLSYGDEIIVIDPSWPAYKDCARLRGVSVRTIKSKEDDWSINLDNLKDAINSNTKMIVLNYPNNPTGKILDEESMNGIVELARRYRITILSDEVYSYYAFKEYKSIASYDDVDYILISSFSKAYSMTGFRVGFVVSNNTSYLKRMIKHQSIALTSVAEPMQYAALKALEGDHKVYSSVMKKRLDYLAERLGAMQLSFYKPDGGMYIFAKSRKEDFNSLKFASSLLEKGVAVTPGVAFGEYNNYIRISACNDEAMLKEGLDILEESLR